MNAPVTYIPNFVANPDEAFEKLWNELAWERRGSTPRREYYSNEIPAIYGYGVRAGYREYHPQPWHPAMLDIKTPLEVFTKSKFEACFVNGYEDSRDWLGWHADDSPEMNDDLPIAIVSLCRDAEREIYFRDKSKPAEIVRLKLEHGSLCLMHPGMQDSHEHKIPKAGFECGRRISLTYRGYVPR